MVLRKNSSSAILFITQVSYLIYNGEPRPLKLFPQPSNSFLPLSGVYLYYSSAETTLQNKPTDCFQSQSCINNIKSETIATFYKYQQAYGATARENVDWQHRFFFLPTLRKRSSMLHVDGPLSIQDTSDISLCFFDQLASSRPCHLKSNMKTQFSSPDHFPDPSFVWEHCYRRRLGKRWSRI